MDATSELPKPCTKALWFPERCWKQPWKTWGCIRRFPERRKWLFRRRNLFSLWNIDLRLSGNRPIRPNIFQGSFQRLSGNRPIHPNVFQGSLHNVSINVQICSCINVYKLLYNSCKCSGICVEPNMPGHFLVRAQLSVMTGHAVVPVSPALRIPRAAYRFPATPEFP